MTHNQSKMVCTNAPVRVLNKTLHTLHRGQCIQAQGPNCSIITSETLTSISPPCCCKLSSRRSYQYPKSYFQTQPSPPLFTGTLEASKDPQLRLRGITVNFDAAIIVNSLRPAVKKPPRAEKVYIYIIIF